MAKKTENQFGAYSREVLKRFTNPKNFGEIKNPDGVGQVGNPVCGDVMKIYFKIKDNNSINGTFLKIDR